MKLIRWMLIPFMIVLLSGCAVKPSEYCVFSTPIWWDTIDDLIQTPDTVKTQIVKHNETYKKICN